MIIKPIASTLTALAMLSSAIASSNVSAAEYEGYFENPQFTSSRSRAEVKQETVQAQRAGLRNTGELGAGFAPLTGQDGNKTAVARKTRAEVLAELRQAYADGSYAENKSEIGILTATKFVDNAGSRTNVRAEAIQSARSSQIVSKTSGK